MKVTKRDGRVVDYDRNKIIIAIQKANAEVEKNNTFLFSLSTNKSLTNLKLKFTIFFHSFL